MTCRALTRHIYALRYRRYAILGASMWLALSPVSLASADPAADLVLLHGKIYTEDSHRTVAQALALRGNTIVAVGTDETVSAQIGPDTRIVNLAGRPVLPGIIDAHTHPAQSAQDLGKCTLGDERLTPAGVKSKVAACLKEHPADRTLWYEVVQVNASDLALTLADLDAMLADHPMILNSADGHTAWVNSSALKASRIDASTPDPVGGRIEHDTAGNPTGTLRDTAAEIAQGAEPTPSLEFAASQLDKAFDAMRATGITSVQDADAGDRDMQIYRRLYDAHRLRMRVRATFGLKSTDRPAEVLIGEAKEFREKWAIDPDFLRADAIKIFADGVIEFPSQTAALLEPYLDAAGRPTNNRGPTYFSQDHLNEIVTAADAAGFTVHIHAIGDRAVRSSLDAFAESRRRLQSSQTAASRSPTPQIVGRDNRDQIAHLELVDPGDFPRFKELGVIANFQLFWAIRDPYIVNSTLAYIGPRRSQYLYPARSLRDAGALIAGGSDWSVSSFDAFEAMERAITRRESRGRAPLLPEQGISLQDVVDAYTINAAYALKQEHTTGSLEPGKRGDFILLDRDIFAIDPFDLHSTRVLSTYLDGQEVYAKRASARSQRRN
jgi:predicted amidohydrolase YtcJ